MLSDESTRSNGRPVADKSLGRKPQEDILKEKPVLSGDGSPLGTDEEGYAGNRDTANMESAVE